MTLLLNMNATQNSIAMFTGFAVYPNSAMPYTAPLILLGRSLCGLKT